MTALDLDRLEALADAATPGPWVHGGMGYVEDVPDNPEDRFDVMPATIARAEVSEADAVFIAETGPDVTKELVRQLREARAGLAKVAAISTKLRGDGHHGIADKLDKACNG